MSSRQTVYKKNHRILAIFQVHNMNKTRLILAAW
jgi:hypothetical protein